jgi:hypothetical protein
MPSSVSVIAWVERCSRRTPSDFSRAFRRRLTVGWVVPSRRAAADRLPASTMRTNVSTSIIRLVVESSLESSMFIRSVYKSSAFGASTAVKR